MTNKISTVDSDLGRLRPTAFTDDPLSLAMLGGEVYHSGIGGGILIIAAATGRGVERMEGLPRETWDRLNEHKDCNRLVVAWTRGLRQGTFSVYRIGRVDDLLERRAKIADSPMWAALAKLAVRSAEQLTVLDVLPQEEI